MKSKRQAKWKKLGWSNQRREVTYEFSVVMAPCTWSSKTTNLATVSCVS